MPGVRGSPAVDAARCARLWDGPSESLVLSESSDTLNESRTDDARLVDRADDARASFAAASEYPDSDADDRDADRFCVVEVAFRNDTSDRSSAESDDAETAEDDARDDGGEALGGARRRVLGGVGGGINRCDR